MDDTRLDDLLKRAGGAPRWSPGEEFAAGVRRRRDRRRRNRRRLAMAMPAALGVLLAASWFAARHVEEPVDSVAVNARSEGGSSAEASDSGSSGVSPVRRPDLQTDDAELARLVAEAEFHERLARRIIDDRRRERALAEMQALGNERDHDIPRASRSRSWPAA